MRNPNVATALPLLSRALSLASLLLVGSGCASAQSVLSQASPPARTVTDLFTTVFWIAVAVFIVTEGILVYSILRFRRRQATDMPNQIHGSTPLEIGWTLAPALIVLFIFTLTVRSMYSVSPPPPNSMTVQVLGHQWWWEFVYPDLNITTADEMHIPAGQGVIVKLTSDNVIHSFWFPQLQGKMDVVPGHDNQWWIMADNPGAYLGQCAEFCGTQHANMRMRVIAQSRAEFEAWVAQNQAAPAAPAGDAERGAQVFANAACVGCHTIQGTKAVGKIGPNLTHFGSRSTIAGGVLENTPQNLATWIRDPQAIKPGNDMPKVGLGDADIQAIVAYLESLK